MKRKNITLFNYTETETETQKVQKVHFISMQAIKNVLETQISKNNNKLDIKRFAAPKSSLNTDEIANNIFSQKK